MRKCLIAVLILSFCLVGCGEADKYLNQANSYLKSGEYKKASLLYEMVLENDKDNKEAMEMKVELENINSIKELIDKDEIDKANKEVDKISDKKILEVTKNNIKKEIEEKNKLRPRLVLEYQVNQSKEETDNKPFYVNGNGKLRLAESDYTLDSRYIDESMGNVTPYVPESTVTFLIKNVGEKPVVNPKMNMKFINMALNFEPSERWEGISHNRGVGNWSEIRWNPPVGTSIQRDQPVKINFGFHSSPISYEGATIEITLSGDNMKAETFKIPVELKQMGGD